MVADYASASRFPYRQGLTDALPQMAKSYDAMNFTCRIKNTGDVPVFFYGN